MTGQDCYHCCLLSDIYIQQYTTCTETGDRTLTARGNSTPSLNAGVGKIYDIYDIYDISYYLLNVTFYSVVAVVATTATSVGVATAPTTSRRTSVLGILL